MVGVLLEVKEGSSEARCSGWSVDALGDSEGRDGAKGCDEAGM